MTRAPTSPVRIPFLPSLTAIRARLFASQKSYSGQCFAITCLGTCLLYLTHSIISGSSESLLSRGPGIGGIHFFTLLLLPRPSFNDLRWGLRNQFVTPFDYVCNRCIKIPLWNISRGPGQGSCAYLAPIRSHILRWFATHVGTSERSRLAQLESFCIRFACQRWQGRTRRR